MLYKAFARKDITQDEREKLDRKLNVSVFNDFDCIFAVELRLKDVEQLKNQLIKIHNLMSS